ncbi:hypothetical protein E2P81_ATG02031 [Venturia nashicola]|uniref:Uncharacterized protein n=1 Tax=Venturia nashicola TaxID=86259 RepID=A0A4Z1PI65_9PEZI|nr:hypothetical protein E6O75_ATG02074 [Venturia nashicola]TLD35728.1 hypothetical protein E2P81_ATG02031 [Venturia nashicola]
MNPAMELSCLRLTEAARNVTLSTDYCHSESGWRYCPSFTFAQPYLVPRKCLVFVWILQLISPSHAEPKDAQIHLQWALCDQDLQTVLQKFGLPSNLLPRKQDLITYYDTRPPIYTQHGLGLRTKTSKSQKISSAKVAS